MANRKSVFISYSSKDGQFVNKIIKMLENMGISYWKAPDMIPAGSNYAREIPQAIRQCEVFLLFLSATSQNSIWVEKEIDSAINYRKTIIPFQIDGTPLSDMYRFYLNNVQMISYSDNPEKAIAELKEQLHRMVTGGTVSDGISTDVQSVTNRVKPEVAEKRDRMAITFQTATVKDSGNAKIQQTNTEKEVSKSIKAGETTSAKTEIVQNKEQDQEDSKPRSDKPVGKKSGRRSRKTEPLTFNRIPIECKYCRGELRKITVGTYRCLECGKDNYDDFQTVRNYLDKAGASPSVVIERETGVPRRVIEQFFREEYLEIPSLSPFRISCEKCGAPIRTGTLCERCKDAEKNQTERNAKGSWYSRW